jgi:hypothetical protein
MKKFFIVAVIFVMALSSSLLAIDTLTLRQNLWKWASLEAVINESLHFNFGHHYTPVVSIDEAYREIEAVRMDVSRSVAAIETVEEMRLAREVADEFKNMFGHEAEVGKTLHKLLDMQEKYLKAHNSVR